MEALEWGAGSRLRAAATAAAFLVDVEVGAAGAADPDADARAVVWEAGGEDLGFCEGLDVCGIDGRGRETTDEVSRRRGSAARSRG